MAIGQATVNQPVADDENNTLDIQDCYSGLSNEDLGKSIPSFERRSSGRFQKAGISPEEVTDEERDHKQASERIVDIQDHPAQNMSFDHRHLEQSDSVRKIDGDEAHRRTVGKENEWDSVARTIKNEAFRDLILELGNQLFEGQIDSAKLAKLLGQIVIDESSIVDELRRYELLRGRAGLLGVRMNFGFTLRDGGKLGIEALEVSTKCDGGSETARNGVGCFYVSANGDAKYFREFDDGERKLITREQSSYLLKEVLERQSNMFYKVLKAPKSEYRWWF